ncbi:MAG: sigma 54-interacting transcriptional regulator [Smithellaceae bacterium]
MPNPGEIFFDLSDDAKLILNHFISFPDFFSVDWFPEFPFSKILSVLHFLEQKHWISPQQKEPGFYTWAASFPRQEIIEQIPPHEMSQIYRNSIPILKRELPENDENALLICRQCLLAGLEEECLDIVLKAAFIEEKNHRVLYALKLYDSMLDFFENITSTTLSEKTWRIVIKAVTRRTSLSFFHPSFKKANRYLLAALNTAKQLGDVRSQASLELLIGQHYWMSIQYDLAAEHFDNGWKIITQIEDEELYKQGLKVRGLTYAVKGQYFKAIEAYEQSLGEIESADDNDFSFFAALNLALSYSQVGMPQRGLGICERIQTHSKKNANWPLLTFALVATGMILLDIMQLKTSRSYFNEALELAKRENLPMAEALSGIALSNIECQEGDFDAAVEHFKLIWRIRKSSTLYTVNYYPIIPTVYMLYSKIDAHRSEFKPGVDFLNQLKREEVSTLAYAMLQRFQLGLRENKEPITEKIKKFLELEEDVAKMGATFELARIRVELARLFNQNCEWHKAENYAKQANDFFEPFAPHCFPSELQHLLPNKKISKNERLFDIVVEMGDALNDHENLERLLSNIITSITRLTGAERAALFIKDGSSSDPKMIASRNFLQEEIQETSFQRSLVAIHSAMTSHDIEIIQYDLNGKDDADFRRVIITPLRSGKRVTGVLYQDSRFFSLKTSPDDIKLLSALASQIGVSIDRAQAYDEIARLNKKLIQENLYYIEEKEEFRPFGEIIGSSSTVRNLHGLIQRVAPTSSTVLLSGETGVGKELVARAIHRESLRGKYPFIRVNCAALPDTLIDSELFGHERGAFTGAVKTREGRFELANLGTIFLDEVSELPLPTQSRLLRIIQEKEFQRVGGTKILHSDFRLITATNKDLQEEVAKGKFREDLFYRLNVFPIHILPLRERKEDIPLLAVHFFKLYCSQSNRPYAGIPEPEMEHLKNYSWPGNIRELSNMIERHIIMGSSTISLPELKSQGNTTKEIKETSLQNGNIKLKNIVQADERRHILEALEKTKGKVGGKDGAAILLGMNRSTLIHRMKKLEIQIEHNPKYTEKIH